MKIVYTLIALAVAGSPFVSAENSLTNPLTLPFIENFADSKYENEGWEIIPIDGETATVELTSRDPDTGLTSYFHRDKGLLVINNDKAGSFYLMSPYVKIDKNDRKRECKLGQAFYCVRNIKAEGVIAHDGGEIVPDGQVNDLWSTESLNPQWLEVYTNGGSECDYDSFYGHVMRFGWKITTNGQGGTLCLDKVTLAELNTYDFGFVNVHATPRALAGEEVTLSADIACFGELSSTEYEVIAKVDGVEIPGKFTPTAITFGTNYQTAEFKYRVPEDAVPGPKTVSFELNFLGDWAGKNDDDLSNNVATATFDVATEFLPGASNLSADGDGVLTWQCMSDGSRFTDTMEGLSSYDDGSIDNLYELDPCFDYDRLIRNYGDRGLIGSYVVYDEDKKATIADDNWVENVVPNIFHLMSCTVADFTVPAGDLGAASGNKALLFWSNQDGTPCDNYLVLPEINSSDLTLSFKARALNADYPEIIEVMASSTDAKVGSFSVVRSVSVDACEYADYEVELPAGTRYVALHHVSDEGYSLLVDDLSFSAKARTILGYNVYRYGRKLNSEPIADKRFATTEDGRYTVTVVYPEGESEPTGYVLIGEDSSIGTVDADRSDAPAVYYNLQGQRVINPQGGVFIEVRNGVPAKVVR